MRTLNIPKILFATDHQLLSLKYFKLAISYVNEGDNYTVMEQITTKPIQDVYQAFRSLNSLKR